MASATHQMPPCRTSQTVAARPLSRWAFGALEKCPVDARNARCSPLRMAPCSITLTWRGGTGLSSTIADTTTSSSAITTTRPDATADRIVATTLTFGRPGRDQARQPTSEDRQSAPRSRGQLMPRGDDLRLTRASSERRKASGRVRLVLTRSATCICVALSPVAMTSRRARVPADAPA
jgi:hypothetical protein